MSTAATPPGTERAARFTLMAGLALFLASAFFSIAVNSLSLGLMALAWLALMLLQKRWLATPTPPDLGFLAYVLAELLATLCSPRPLESLIIARRVLLIGIVYFLAANLRDERDLGRAMTILLGSAVAVALVGMGKLLLAPPAQTVRLGIFQFYMTTSGVMMIAGLLLIPFVLARGAPRWVRWAAAGGLVPVAVALYATVTRGAYLAFAAGVLLIALVRSRRLVVPLLALIVLAVFFAPPYVEERIRSIADLSHPENASRVMLWGIGLRIFADHPVVGVGDIDLGTLFDRYGASGPEHWGHLHNVALQLLVTLGAVGFLAATAMFVLVARTEWRAYRAARGRWLPEAVALGALAAFAGFHVHGLTEWTLGDQEVAVLLWITVGCAVAAGRIAGRKEAV
jgi:O-antigen ligase